MKAHIKYFVITGLVLCQFAGKTFSQFSDKRQAKVSSYAFGDKLSNPKGDGSLAESRVSQPALISFSKSFQDVSQIKWFRVKKLYEVDFLKNENQSKCLYNVKGRLIYSVLYGSEKDLPGAVKRIVKREYYDYNITKVFEIQQGHRDIWLIDMEYDKNLLTVRVEGGLMEELNNFIRSQ
ncbi:MAG: hypothetical protein ABI472_09215 [Ginsengibacter sp.]